ncbi:MAG: hypothetical protein JRJ47_14750 [Deltaproteobacteria bacterium]|nr:hypothetical protein [Deltaproteobacteria bacterium]
MKDENYYNTTERLSLAGARGPTHDPSCTAGEQVRLRALALFIIRSTAEKHGGTAQIDLATDSINIDIPEKEKAACVREIEAQLRAIGPQPESSVQSSCAVSCS